MSLSSCNGMLDDIYDVPQESTSDGYGFLLSDDATASGKVRIDATDYKKWTYIDFRNKVCHATEIGEDGTDTAPAEWDIAVHRYDTKTNGASVCETDENVLGKPLPAGAAFAEDVYTTDRIATDMSGMMDGNILYAPSYYNEVLSRWLKVDTSNMPPTYTLSGRVYIVKLKDGRHIGLKLSDFMNPAGVKGHMTIDYYIYPQAEQGILIMNNPLIKSERTCRTY